MSERKLLFRPSKPIVVAEPTLTDKEKEKDEQWELVDSDKDSKTDTLTTTKRKRNDEDPTVPAKKPTIQLKDDPEVKEEVAPDVNVVKTSLQKAKTFGSAFSESAGGAGFAALATKATSTGFNDLLSTANTETAAKTRIESTVVESHTGEESDVAIKKIFAELKVFDAVAKEWRHRGFGPLHLNLLPPSAASKHVRARLGTSIEYD
jgi:hypothetical protein